MPKVVVVVVVVVVVDIIVVVSLVVNCAIVNNLIFPGEGGEAQWSVPAFHKVFPSVFFSRQDDNV